MSIVRCRTMIRRGLAASRCRSRICGSSGRILALFRGHAMTKSLYVSCFTLALLTSPSVHAQTTRIALPPVIPTVDQILSLDRVGTAVIAPDGRSVAYTVRETNWEDNEYETEIWIADVATGARRQLTNGRKSSMAPAWSPDGSTIAFVSDRTDKRQIYLINPRAGEADALTSAEDGVSAFEWSPDGRSIAYTARDPKTASLKDREKKYGEFEVVEQDQRMTHLFVVDVAAKTTRRLTSGAF